MIKLSTETKSFIKDLNNFLKNKGIVLSRVASYWYCFQNEDKSIDISIEDLLSLREHSATLKN